MVRIGSNISSLQALRRLAESSTQLSGTYERLSSGLRINRAADDAAGLSVADRLGVNARLFGTAVRNLNDGVSMLNIIDGSLSQQTEVLFRLKELAHQAANGTLSNAQRETLDQEYYTLINEFGRLGDSTQFNGLNLLRANHSDGVGQILLQAGITGAASSRLTLNGINSGSWSGIIDLSRIGTTDFNLDGDQGTDQDIQRIAGPTSFDALMASFGNQAAHLQITDSSGQQRDLVVGFIGDGTSVTAVSFLKSASDGMYYGTAQAVSEFNYLNAGNGARMDIDPTTGRIMGSAIAIMDDGLGGAFEIDLAGLEFQDATTGYASTAIQFTGVSTIDRARYSLDIIDARLNALAQTRGMIGALQSRIESALQVNYVSREASLSAESRIRDTDIAYESSQLIRLRILQQAGAAVLSQANTQPQLALTLLRN